MYIVCPSIEENDDEVDVSFADIDTEGNVNREKPRLKAAVP